MIKIFILLSIILASCAQAPASSVSVISSASSLSDQNITSSTNQELRLTLEQLKEFDGSFGKKAYIAVDGIIYDVTGNSNWFLGNHNGFKAGRDLTYEIDNVSPHGRAYLTRVPRVGVIVD
jgi:predicted heme/steroid binding protein